MPTPPAGLALWHTLLDGLPPERHQTLQGWLHGGGCLPAQDALPGWPPRQRVVAVVILQLAFVADSKRDARIVAENTMSRTPPPAGLLPALPWGMLTHRPEALQYPFQVHDILRVLDAWGADPTDAIVSLLEQQVEPRRVLYTWLGKQPPSATTLGVLASGLADKRASTVRTCTDALVAHGHPAIEHVVTVLAAPAAGARRAAAEVLGRIGAPAAVDDLQAALAAERSKKTRDAMTAALAQCAAPGPRA